MDHLHRDNARGVSREKLDLFNLNFGSSLLTGESLAPYFINCEGSERAIPFVFKPQSESLLGPFLKLCKETHTTFYPISRGQNWGYGSSLPSQSDSAILDLSLLEQIDIDEDLGIVTLQPGVTPQKLHDFLETRNSKWMSPLTGAGPHGSILGNALERGFGLNPISDHFASILAVRAFLADGTIYHSRLADLGAWRSDMVSQWKIGPYQEGLFSQSNLGVVTALTIRLAPKPTSVNFLIVKCKESALPSAIEKMNQLHYQFGGLLGGINISNRKRIESTLANGRQKGVFQSKLPTEDQVGGESIDQAKGPLAILTNSSVNLLYKLSGLNLDEIQIVIPLFNYDSSYGGLNQKVLSIFKKGPFETKLLNERTLHRLLKLKPIFRSPIFNDLWEKVESIYHFSRLLRGVPNSFSLKVAYTRAPEQQVHNHPPRDGVGLLWFAPILRLKVDDFTKSIQIIERILPLYNQPIMWTFTVINSCLVEATIPVYFNPLSELETQRAHQCWKALFEAFLEQGIAPYRYSIDHMEYGQYKTAALKELQHQLKKAFDPHQLISPRRYLP